jgi:hypothetical protein
VTFSIPNGIIEKNFSELSGLCLLKILMGAVALFQCTPFFTGHPVDCTLLLIQSK